MLQRTLCLLFLAMGFSVSAQQAAIGQWRDYLPYGQTFFVVDAGSHAYASTPYSVIALDKSEKSFERLSTVTGLSDFGVSTLGIHEDLDIVIIGYENGNLDLIQGNRIINLADIKRASILTSKRVNRVHVFEGRVFLACGFGIVELNLEVENFEVKDTYFIGADGAFLDVLDLAYDGTSLYATTTTGVLRAAFDSPQLGLNSSWTQLSFQGPEKTLSTIFHFAGNTYGNYASGKFASDTLYILENDSWKFFDGIETDNNNGYAIDGDRLILARSSSVQEFNTSMQLQNTIFTYGEGDGIRPPAPNNLFISGDTYWVADDRQGLVEVPSENQFNSTIYLPDGPLTANAYNLTIDQGQMWVAPGGRNGQWSNIFIPDGIFSYIDNTWFSINRSDEPALIPVSDFVSIAVDPNQTNRVYAASIGTGLVEFTDGMVTNIFDNTNSVLDTADIGFPGFLAVTDVQYDQEGNLWMTNLRVNDFLAVKRANGSWVDFDFSAANLQSPVVGPFIITSFGQKWALITDAEFGIFVFDENGTLSNTADDQFTILTQNQGEGGLPSNEVFSIVEDLDNEIWVGTAAGIAVFFNPSGVLDPTSSSDAQQILVTQNGFTGFLLETETVLALAVDGADRKWVGTDGAGVFLLSADGTEELLHFTTENSPLFSDVINDIEIDPETGEVFIATDAGLLSYWGDATGGDFEFGDVLAFPNPVQSGYDGPIAIRGLARNSVVKITDITGNVVFESIANGGQAVWDGKDFNGRRPSTGVYLVFAGKQDGQASIVTKILFVN